MDEFSPIKLVAMAPILALIVVFIIFKTPHHYPDFSDFRVYVEAGKKALEHHTVYDVEGHYQYKYAPFISLLFGLFFGHGDWGTLTWSYYGLSVIAWGVLLAWVIQQSVLQETSPIRPSMLFFFLLAFYATPLRDELKLGQINWFPFGLVLIATKLLDQPSKKAQTGAGLILGMAVQVKLFALILLGDWFWRRKWLACIGVLLSYVLCNWVLLLAYHGWTHTLSENRLWLSTLTQSSSELLNSQYNVSLMGYLIKWGLGPVMVRAIWMIAVIAALVAQMWIARQTQPFSGLAIALVFVLILNPLTWPYWLLFTLPASAILAQRLLASKRYRSAVLLSGIFGAASFLQNDPYVWFQGGELWASFALMIYLSLFLKQKELLRQKDLYCLAE